MANLCREAAYGPIRESAESIQHIAADEVHVLTYLCILGYATIALCLAGPVLQSILFVHSISESFSESVYVVAILYWQAHVCVASVMKVVYLMNLVSTDPTE